MYRRRKTLKIARKPQRNKKMGRNNIGEKLSKENSQKCGRVELVFKHLVYKVTHAVVPTNSP
jgi:hypothetical protein